MKELSQEIITINGQDYTLFLNRKGIVAWENYTKVEKEKLQNMREKYSFLIDNLSEKNEQGQIEIADDTNPFEGMEGYEDMDEDHLYITSIYKRMYWIMLYTNHKLSISESSKLYDDACKEYGEEQVIQLANQMVEEVNTDPNPPKLKNLAALKPKKN